MCGDIFESPTSLQSSCSTQHYLILLCLLPTCLSTLQHLSAFAPPPGDAKPEEEDEDEEVCSIISISDQNQEETLLPSLFLMVYGGVLCRHLLGHGFIVVVLPLSGELKARRFFGLQSETEAVTGRDLKTSWRSSRIGFRARPRDGLLRGSKR